MHKHPFRQFIEQYVAISDTVWDDISSCIAKEVLPKNHLILEAGKVYNYLYFLESGLLRFFIWRDGNDISKFFTLPPYCFTSQA